MKNIKTVGHCEGLLVHVDFHRKQVFVCERWTREHYVLWMSHDGVEEMFQTLDYENRQTFLEFDANVFLDEGNNYGFLGSFRSIVTPEREQRLLIQFTDSVFCPNARQWIVPPDPGCEARRESERTLRDTMNDATGSGALSKLVDKCSRRIFIGLVDEISLRENLQHLNDSLKEEKERKARETQQGEAVQPSSDAHQCQNTQGISMKAAVAEPAEVSHCLDRGDEVRKTTARHLADAESVSRSTSKARVSMQRVVVADDPASKRSTSVPRHQSEQDSASDQNRSRSRPPTTSVLRSKTETALPIAGNVGVPSVVVPHRQRQQERTSASVQSSEGNRSSSLAALPRSLNTDSIFSSASSTSTAVSQQQREQKSARDNGSAGNRRPTSAALPPRVPRSRSEMRTDSVPSNISAKTSSVTVPEQKPEKKITRDHIGVGSSAPSSIVLPRSEIKKDCSASHIMTASDAVSQRQLEKKNAREQTGNGGGPPTSAVLPRSEIQTDFFALKKSSVAVPRLQQEQESALDPFGNGSQSASWASASRSDTTMNCYPPSVPVVLGAVQQAEVCDRSIRSKPTSLVADSDRMTFSLLTTPALSVVPQLVDDDDESRKEKQTQTSTPSAHSSPPSGLVTPLVGRRGDSANGDYNEERNQATSSAAPSRSDQIVPSLPWILQKHVGFAEPDPGEPASVDFISDEDLLLFSEYRDSLKKPMSIQEANDFVRVYSIMAENYDFNEEKDFTVEYRVAAEAMSHAVVNKYYPVEKLSSGWHSTLLNLWYAEPAMVYREDYPFVISGFVISGVKYSPYTDDGKVRCYTRRCGYVEVPPETQPCKGSTDRSYVYAICYAKDKYCGFEYNKPANAFRSLKNGKERQGAPISVRGLGMLSMGPDLREGKERQWSIWSDVLGFCPVMEGSVSQLRKKNHEYDPACKVVLIDAIPERGRTSMCPHQWNIKLIEPMEMCGVPTMGGRPEQAYKMSKLRFFEELDDDYLFKTTEATIGGFPKVGTIIYVRKRHTRTALPNGDNNTKNHPFSGVVFGLFSPKDPCDITFRALYVAPEPVWNLLRPDEPMYKMFDEMEI